MLMSWITYPYFRRLINQNYRGVIIVITQLITTLPEANKSNLKIGQNPERPSIFRDYVCFREGTSYNVILAVIEATQSV